MAEDQLRRQAEEVWSQIDRRNIAWGKLFRGLVILIIIILLIVYRNPIAQLIALALRQTTGLLDNASQALVVANYLLATLIVATMLVELIPFLSNGSGGRNYVFTASHTWKMY